SEQGYYLLNGDYLYFIDKLSATPVLLDNRPDHECLVAQDGDNCNAYVSLLNQESVLLQLYKDHLYTIEYHFTTESKPSMNGFFTGYFELVKRDPDGSNRKVLTSLRHATITGAGIHRGYLYYSVVDYDKDNNQKYQIFRQSLHKLNKAP